MKGGYQIIDLRDISLELSGSAQTITNIGILNQLLLLREHIEKNHNFLKPLNNALKCVMIRYRDGKNGEKLETCQFASIICSNDSLTYEIKAKGLNIEVIFEEKTDEDGNKYYDIKTAKYLYNHNEIIEGDLTIGGDLSVTGNAILLKINSEENPSVKPIYFHPIILLKGQVTDLTTYARITMIILDNKSTPYSLEELFDKMKSIESGRFKADGIDINTTQPLYFYNQPNTSIIQIVHATTSATNLSKEEFVTYFNQGISDECNKIN